MKCAPSHPSAKAVNGIYWRAQLFQGLWYLGTTSTDRCTQKDEESNRHCLLAPIRQLEVRASSCRLSWGMAPYNIPNEEEIQECAVSWKNHGQNLVGWEGCVLLNFLPRGTTVTPTIVVKHWEVEFVPLLSLSYKKNVCNIAPLWQYLCAPQRPSQILDGHFWCISLAVLNLHCQILVHLFGLQIKVLGGHY